MGKLSVYHMIPTLSVEKRAGGSIMFKEQTKKSYAWLQAWDRVLSVPDTSVLKRWGPTEPTSPNGSQQQMLLNGISTYTFNMQRNKVWKWNIVS